MEKLFFDNWQSILRTFLITVMAYVFLILLLRRFGKRTLTRMNAFDFIVTVALGSTLATVMLNKDVALLDGMLAFFLLIGLQYLISFFCVKSPKINGLVKGTPALLVFKGKLIRPTMNKERITEDEVHAAAREHGIYAMEQIDAMILETDGSISVLSQGVQSDSSVMKGVKDAGTY